MDWTICSAVAVLLTTLDVLRTFYVPTTKGRKLQFYSWGGIFALGNGALAALLYANLKGFEALSSIGPYTKALLIGTSYLVLIRSKLATIKVQDQEIPLGLEYLYNSCKEVIYKRMNRVSIQGLTEEAALMAASQTLKALATQVSAYITNDNLLPSEQKTARKSWLLKTLEDTTSEEEKKRVLATYVLSERM